MPPKRDLSNCLRRETDVPPSNTSPPGRFPPLFAYPDISPKPTAHQKIFHTEPEQKFLATLNAIQFLRSINNNYVIHVVKVAAQLLLNSTRRSKLVCSNSVNAALKLLPWSIFHKHETTEFDSMPTKQGD